MKMTTNEVNVEAVVLKQIPYKDNDMILHVYTKDYGKLSFVAKGIRKLTSKNARASSPMMISEFSVNLKKGLSTLIKASPINYLRHIKESIESEIVGNYILEYFYRYVEENEPDEDVYKQLIKSLKALDYGYSPLLVYCLFQVFILNHNGISIDVDGCVVCGSLKVVSISVDEGGFVCEQHYKNNVIYPKEVLKAFRHLHKLTIDSIDSFNIEECYLKEITKIHDMYIDEYCGIVLKSSTFIKQIV